MSIGYEVGKWLGKGCPLPQQKTQKEIVMSDDEIDLLYSLKGFFDSYDKLNRKHQQWLKQEEKKAAEGMTVWNYATRTGKFENWD